MLNILVIKEMKIKTTMRYPFTPTRMATIKTENYSCYYVEKLGIHISVVGM